VAQQLEAAGPARGYQARPDRLFADGHSGIAQLLDDGDGRGGVVELMLAEQRDAQVFETRSAARTGDRQRLAGQIEAVLS
jgi:hypothetical protein